MSSNARKLRQQLGRADNYTQWKAAAIACDEHMGLASWKQVDISRRYDYRSIRSRLDRLCELRERQDDAGLPSWLRITAGEGIGKLISPDQGNPESTIKQLPYPTHQTHLS